MACMRCTKTILRRFRKDEENQIVCCWNCNARYKLVGKPEKKVEWVPEQISFNCPNEGCDAPYFFWVDEVKVGGAWTCDDCESKWVFALGVSPDNDQPLFTLKE